MRISGVLLAEFSLIPKRALRKYLFDFRVPLGYKTVVRVYQSCLDESDPNFLQPSKDVDQVPPYQLMTLKRILENYRKSSGVISKRAVDVENNLVDRASELGDYAAIALLCGRTLASSPGSDQQLTRSTSDTSATSATSSALSGATASTAGSSNITAATSATSSGTSATDSTTASSSGTTSATTPANNTDRTTSGIASSAASSAAPTLPDADSSNASVNADVSTGNGSNTPSNNGASSIVVKESSLPKDEITVEDRQHANLLLRQLMDKKFPLAFKIAGDLAYQRNQREKARQFYQLAIDNGIQSDNSLYVECLRNIGLICLMTKDQIDLVTARRYFDKAVASALDLNQVSDCHFYLGQILEKNQTASRYHLEKAASTGLRQAFAPLGFLLLNYFNKVELAQQWFELGSSIDDINCHTGLFDCLMKLGDYEGAARVLDKIRRDEKGDLVVQSRKKLIEQLEQHRQGPPPGGSGNRNDGADAGSERWSF
ncbi:Mss2p [Sugiyamaella lignohabitans]|uniref:Mss2p n=1 Tax=Sugiyamaella lignohabitans TaxID=796027 RepID=A0A167CPC7_9ASCO|nr:Mss2p [Sugiyamaella lignohabitans]ANB11949.1 Mss2p [Sugiyamaella lignohabitans]